MEEGYGGDYVQMALYTLMNSVCGYLECKVSDTDVPSKPLAIDEVLQFKLEQAADLIKKHLLLSVREEMEAMKGKLSALEMKIYRLEMENMLLLREYVPADILERRMSESVEETDEGIVDRWSDSRMASSCAFDQQRLVGGSQIQEFDSNANGQGQKLDQTLPAAPFASSASG